jgi:hypothetical protein
MNALTEEMRRHIGHAFQLCREPKVLAVAMRARLDLNLPMAKTYQDLTTLETPMDWDGLLNSDDLNFAHDLYGIRAHLQTRTGKLIDCFLPRYAIHSYSDWNET